MVTRCIGINGITQNGPVKTTLKKLFINFWRTLVLLAGLLWTSGNIFTGFRSQGGSPSLACFIACVWHIPQILLWCDTCQPLGNQFDCRSHCPLNFFKQRWQASTIRTRILSVPLSRAFNHSGNIYPLCR